LGAEANGSPFIANPRIDVHPLLHPLMALANDGACSRTTEMDRPSTKIKIYSNF